MNSVVQLAQSGVGVVVLARMVALEKSALAETCTRYWTEVALTADHTTCDSAFSFWPCFFR